MASHRSPQWRRAMHYFYEYSSLPSTIISMILEYGLWQPSDVMLYRYNHDGSYGITHTGAQHLFEPLTPARFILDPNFAVASSSRIVMSPTYTCMAIIPLWQPGQSTAHIDITVITWRNEATETKTTPSSVSADESLVASNHTTAAAVATKSSAYVNPLLLPATNGCTTARHNKIRIQFVKENITNTIPAFLRSHTMHVWYSNDGTRLYIGRLFAIQTIPLTDIHVRYDVHVI
jgi:hypothetical protein